LHADTIAQNPGSREVCRRALTIGIAAAWVAVYVILGVRTGIIDLSGQEQTGVPSQLAGCKIESSFATYSLRLLIIGL